MQIFIRQHVRYWCNKPGAAGISDDDDRRNKRPLIRLEPCLKVLFRDRLNRRCGANGQSSVSVIAKKSLIEETHRISKIVFAKLLDARKLKRFFLLDLFVLE
jgi:hypothetical protein